MRHPALPPADHEGEPESSAVDPIDECDPADAEMLRLLFLNEAEGHLQRLDAAYEGLVDAASAPGFAPGKDVDALFRALHTLKGAAGSVGHDAIAQAAHEMEDLCAEIRSGELLPTPGILERFSEEMSRLKALLEGARQLAPSTYRAPAGTDGSRPPRERRQGERRLPGDRRLSMDSGAIEALSDQVGDFVVLRTRIERRIEDVAGVKRELSAGRKAMRRSLATLNAALEARGASADRGVRRALSRLTELELEVATSVSHLDRAAHGLHADAEAIRRNTQDLDENLRTLRLVSINWLYRRLQLALEEIRGSNPTPLSLVTEGGELELDRSLLEQLFEPLLHLLRNAVIHGIETPEARGSAGKPETGELSLSVRLEGEFVFLTFADDGRGVDREAVKRVLVRRNRLAPDAHLSDDQLMETLFEPGFSTRTTADALAGRGMGLNIVKTSVMKLGGSVSCHFSPGKGTIFTLCVPLASAITQALLFKLGGQVYGIPLSQVVAALPPVSDLHTTGQTLLGSDLRLASGQVLPLLKLQGLLGVESPPDHRLSLLHLRFGERQFVITCDRIIGPRTVVIRPLGPILSLLPYFSGAAVSGKGKVQLLLDVAALAALALRTERLPVVAARRSSVRVLVVDDSRLAREAATRALASIGVQTLTAEDGWEAWELLNERRFDAVVTDLEMPRVDGFALIARIRKDPTLRRMPVVVLSSRASSATQERARRLGADAVVVKAPQRKALLHTVQKLLFDARANL